MKNRIIELINHFVAVNEHNRLPTTNISYFEKPLVKFAAANDSLFEEYKQIIGSFHFSPREAFEIEFGEDSWRSGTVISVVLPINEVIRKSNRIQNEFASREWALLRTFGDEFFMNSLSKFIINMMQQKGFRALNPTKSSNFKIFSSIESGIASNWSERHVAYVAGQGSFSLNDGFITEKGMAIRMISIVTDAILEPDARTVKHYAENCLFLSNGNCGVCIKRCPTGAITKEGHNKNKCYAFTYSEEGRQRAVAWGGEYQFGSGCGLCQTKVPCEYKIPKHKILEH